MSQEFDLTKIKGARDAKTFMEMTSENSAIARACDKLPRPLRTPAKLYLSQFIVMEIGGRMLGRMFSPEKLLVQQKQTAVDLIREGKLRGVDEMNITMSEKAGIGLTAGVDGNSVDFTLGKAGELTLHVKYK